MDYPEIINKYCYSRLSPEQGGKIFFIAEIGTGHLGKRDLAKSMIDSCRAQGVSAVKFQHVIADEILHPQCGGVKLSSGEFDLFHYFKKIEEKVDVQFWQDMIRRCRESSILFLSSFFGEKSFHDLNDLGVEAYKLASPEMNYYRLWRELIKVEEAVFFSSGLAREEDLQHLFKYLNHHRFRKERLIHLHCVTEYPALPEHYDLTFADWFEKNYGVLTGLSDHSNDPYLLPVVFTGLRAMRGLPSVIEKHVTLKDLKDNIDDSVAINEEQLEELLKCLSWVYGHFNRLSLREGLMDSHPNNQNRSDISSLLIDELPICFKRGGGDYPNAMDSILQANRNTLEKILGSGDRQLSPSEEFDYPTTKRSLLAIRNIEVGEKISRDNAAYLRSEKNISPGLDYHWEEKVFGLKTKKPIRSGAPITESDLHA